jgi:hypothetical protein
MPKPNAGRSRGLPQLTIRLSTLERAELLRRASEWREAGSAPSVSAYVRRMCLAGWKPPLESRN